jgi:hypothetical protein
MLQDAATVVPSIQMNYSDGGYPMKDRPNHVIMSDREKQEFLHSAQLSARELASQNHSLDGETARAIDENLLDYL